MNLLAAIFGCAGPRLTAEEATFFHAVRPWGFILFKRNVETPDQVRALVDDLRDTIGAADAPVLIDQEGGRVQRLGPPHWPKYPPGRAYGGAGDLARLGGRLIANDLAALGINVDCAPVLDVPEPGAHDVIGDRAYAATADEVAALGRAMAEGLLAGGVLPVMKHIPGHGRAGADSHHGLPVVKAPREALARDFAPFRACADLPAAMTAHVVYAAIDPDRPATISKTVIDQTIRGEIGFDGLLMTDDLSMKALGGDFEGRARAALAAGCDVILHCNGDMAEMKGVAAGAALMTDAAERRAAAALARIAAGVEPFEATDARQRFAEGLQGEVGGVSEAFQPDLDFEAARVATETGEALIIDLDGYEGPLDLLLALARSQKVDLLQISIAKLADQYLAFVREARKRRFSLAADYLVMAAWLAWLKSRLLLPKPKRDTGEPAAHDIAEQLAFRLAKLDAMRKAADTLLDGPRLGREVFVRGDASEARIVSVTRTAGDLYELMDAYVSQRRREARRKYSPAPQQAYALESARERLRGLVDEMRRWTPLTGVAPMEHAGHGPTRASFVASTLSATLELVREGDLEARQLEHFAEIYLRSRRAA